MNRPLALRVSGGLVGLLASVFPLWIGAFSVSCICGTCANPIPALLMFPIASLLMLALRQFTDPPALVAALAIALAVLQLPAYGVFLVSESLRKWPHRGIAVAV